MLKLDVHLDDMRKKMSKSEVARKASFRNLANVKRVLQHLPTNQTDLTPPHPKLHGLEKLVLASPYLRFRRLSSAKKERNLMKPPLDKRVIALSFRLHAPYV